MTIIQAVIQENYEPSGIVHRDYTLTFTSEEQLHAFIKRRGADLELEADYVCAFDLEGELLSDSRYLA